MVKRQESLAKYGVLILGLIVYFTSVEPTTRNLGAFIALIGLLLLALKR